MTLFETRIPPPVVGLICGALMWFTDRLVAPIDVPPPLRYGLALLLAAAGVAVSGAAARTFGRAKTTLNPLTPAEASALVTSGIFSYSRNPMYVGMLLLLAGWAVFLSNPLGLAGLALFMFWITRFQILPEERALATLFGEEFARYRQRVRRWL